MTASVPAINIRRRRRIERELRALHAMRSHLNTRDIVMSVVAIPALALLCLLVGAKFHIAFGHAWVSVLAALACGGAIWLIGRHWFNLALLIVIGLLAILFEDFPVNVRPDDGKTDRKTARRLKLEQAIARREALLGIDKAP